MPAIPACPQCGLENTYADGALWTCPDCGHEWAAGDADADGRDLALRSAGGGGQPHAGPARNAPGRHAEDGHRADHGLLHAADVVHDQHVVGQLHDRVGHQLSGTVPRDLAAPVDVDDGRSVDGTLVRLGPAARREHGGVLQQQDRVVDLACDALGVQVALQLPRVGVVQGLVAIPVVEDRQVAHVLTVVRGLWMAGCDRDGGAPQ